MRIDWVVGVALLAALLAGGLIGGLWRDHARRAAIKRWPRRWNLNARPLFNSHELSLYRELRLALPQHVVLSKMSLLRFCHASEANEARAWYGRLQGLYVSMVVCTPTGTVISAIDMVTASSKHVGHSQKLKEATLEACRVRYLRCMPGQWPQGALLASWALGQAGASTPASLTPEQLHDAGDQLARKLKERRAERAARWADSSFAQDSFFAGDSRFDEGVASNPHPFTPTQSPTRR